MTSNGGMVPNSSQKNTTRFFSFPSFRSAMAKSSLDRFWIMSVAMKFFVRSSSGRIKKIAHLSEAKVSASMELSKQSICSISVSRNALSRDRIVDMTDAMVWSEALRAEPASHLALCVGGSRSMSAWNPFFSWLNWLGARRSCVSLNTDMMCRTSASPSLGGRNSDRSSVMAARAPSAAS